jgi:hypothetical protein
VDDEDRDEFDEDEIIKKGIGSDCHSMKKASP